MNAMQWMNCREQIGGFYSFGDAVWRSELDIYLRALPLHAPCQWPQGTHSGNSVVGARWLGTSII
jgi:hypothetical protein